MCMPSFIEVKINGREQLINTSMLVRVSKESVTDIDHTATIYVIEDGIKVSYLTDEHYGAIKEKLNVE